MHGNIAADPSPTAAAIRRLAFARTSPTAKMPGTLVFEHQRIAVKRPGLL